MLTRTPAAGVVPRADRLRPSLPSLRALMLRLGGERRRSLLMQERADAARERCMMRHEYGRRQ